MKKDSPEPRPPPHRSRSLGSATAAAAVAAVEHVGFPSRASTSAVPFSWEQRPGIPKPSGNLACPSPSPRSDPLLLPLPPPLRSAPLAPRRRRSTTSAAAAADPDPFAAALAECAKDPPPRDIEEIWWTAAAAAAERRRAAAERLGFMGGMYGSCKAGCSVVESTVHVPRSGIRTGGYGLVNRR